MKRFPTEPLHKQRKRSTTTSTKRNNQHDQNNNSSHHQPLIPFFKNPNATTHNLSKRKGGSTGAKGNRNRRGKTPPVNQHKTQTKTLVDPKQDHQVKTTTKNERRKRKNPPTTFFQTTTTTKNNTLKQQTQQQHDKQA